MTTANFNFTNRKEIKQSSFDVCLLDQPKESTDLNVQIYLNLKNIKINKKDSIIVIDAFGGGKHERFELDYVERQNCLLGDYQNKYPKFRLAIISDKDNQRGKILSASKDYQLAKKKDHADGGADIKEFFQPKFMDLNERIWKVSWKDEASPILWINSKIENIYGGNIRDPRLQAYILPAVFKEILEGVLLRFSDYEEIEDSDVKNWFEFAEKILDIKPPEVKSFREGELVATAWLEWVEDVMETFSTWTSKKRGNKSLLELLQEKEND